MWQKKLPYEDLGWTGLSWAIKLHQTREALKLIKRCRDANYRFPGGDSILCIAARSSEVKILRELLRRGAAPNPADSMDAQPLLDALAAAQNHQEDAYERAFEMVKLLLEAGADPDLPGRGHGTARTLAKYLAPGPISEYLKAWPARPADGT